VLNHGQRKWIARNLRPYELPMVSGFGQVGRGHPCIMMAIRETNVEFQVEGMGGFCRARPRWNLDFTHSKRFNFTAAGEDADHSAIERPVAHDEPAGCSAGS